MAGSLLTGCLGNGGGGGDSGPIKIGALEPFSGNFAPWGKSHEAGLKFAAEQINANGGVDGRNLEILTRDTESDATKATNTLQSLVSEEDINVATGPVSSDVGIQTSLAAAQLEVPLFLHQSGSTEAIKPETDFTYRVGLLPASTTMEAQAQIIEQEGYESVGAIIANYAWGQSIKAGIQNKMPVDVEIKEASPGEGDFRSFLRQLPSDMDMMIMTGHPPGTISIAKQMDELGIYPETTTESGFPPNVLWGALGEVTQKVGLAHLHNTDVYGDNFSSVASSYADEKNAYMTTITGYGYVTAQVIAEAVRQAGSAERADINSAVKDLTLETLFAEPIQWADSGELDGQRQLYSKLEAGAPSYYSSGKWRLKEFFRSDPLAAIPASE